MAKRRGRKTKYAKLLEDPRFQKKRLEVFQRDKWKCQWCFTGSETLHLHHAYYEYGLDPWDYDTATLHTVGKCCHDLADELRKDLHRETAKLSLSAQRWLMVTLRALRNRYTNLEIIEAFRAMTAEAQRIDTNKET